MSTAPSLTPAQQQALTHAELQIAAVLRALEETTGMVVKYVELNDLGNVEIFLRKKQRTQP